MKIEAKVWVNKGNGQKLITIPKNCNIKAGQKVYVDSKEGSEI